MNKHIIKKEFHESLYESKGLWMVVAVTCILTALCVLVVNIKEGSVLAQNDILQYAIKAVLFLTLTVSMVLGASSLSVVDQDRKQSFPMDEFGADSYQTRAVTALEPGKICEVVFPIRVMYVGNFRMVVNAVNYDTNKVYTSDALTVLMTSNSNLNRTLVMVVAFVVPVILFVVTYILMRKRGQRKK